MARLGVPVGGRVRKLRAVEDQSAPIPEESNERAWKDHLDGLRLFDARGGSVIIPLSREWVSVSRRLKQAEQANV